MFPDFSDLSHRNDDQNYCRKKYYDVKLKFAPFVQQKCKIELSLENMALIHYKNKTQVVTTITL